MNQQTGKDTLPRSSQILQFIYEVKVYLNLTILPGEFEN